MMIKIPCPHRATLLPKRRGNDLTSLKNGSVIGERVRVARWYIFKPKIQFWVKFGGSCNGRCWYILC
jgi:hypothetical protein